MFAKELHGVLELAGNDLGTVDDQRISFRYHVCLWIAFLIHMWSMQGFSLFTSCTDLVEFHFLMKTLQFDDVVLS